MLLDKDIVVPILVVSKFVILWKYSLLTFCVSPIIDYETAVVLCCLDVHRQIYRLVGLTESS